MNKLQVQLHPYHLVSPSPWPINTSFSLFGLALSAALSFHYFSSAYILFFNMLMLSIFSMFFWFRDVSVEGSLLGNHTVTVRNGLSLGFLLFIISEVLFFMGIFWAYFHSSLTPTVELGGQWPPIGLEPVNPFELPLLNTMILLSSGATITYSHHCLIKGDRKGALNGSILTIFLALIFTAFQWLEYSVSSFSISDGVFGSCFFFGTGFHGLHVIIGTIFILISTIRIYNYKLTDNHHLGLESSILYWHFVDIVWLFLYFSIYYWGS